MTGPQLAYLIDTTFARQTMEKEDGHRRHLGASVIGRECERQIYFGFRWADCEKFLGQMYRLFERGQLEEVRFVDLLKRIGATVWTHDDKGEQFRIFAFGGHFAGSCDGVARLPDEPEPVLLEMKTHGDNSFAKLKSAGMPAAKPEHYSQMVVYMHHLKLKRGLYMAINKNTDELYLEFVDYDYSVAITMEMRAERIIFGLGDDPHLPERISENPDYFACRFCAFKGVCHGTKMPRVNCRTCVHASPKPEGGWACARGRVEIELQPKAGCDRHIFNPILFPMLPVVMRTMDNITYQRNGQMVTNGVDGVASGTVDLTTK